jgi:hypothetical protein
MNVHRHCANEIAILREMIERDLSQAEQRKPVVLSKRLATALGEPVGSNDYESLLAGE